MSRLGRICSLNYIFLGIHEWIRRGIEIWRIEDVWLVLIWYIHIGIIIRIGVRLIRFLRYIRIIVLHKASLITGTAGEKDYKKRK